MRHREWNPKSFFRQLTPAALQTLEEWAGVTFQPEGGTPTGDQVYSRWKTLAEHLRGRIEADLLRVNDMCSRHARPYLEGLAPEIWRNGSKNLLDESRDWSAQDLAIRLFVADPTRFAEAHQTYAVDRMDHFPEFQGRYPVRLIPTPESKARMKEAMAHHLRGTAFGARCQVEDYVDHEKFAVFVFHEDEMTPLDRFNELGMIEPDWHRPVVRLAAVFQFDTCTLLVKAPRKVEREKLRDLFAEVLIGDKDYFEDAWETPKYCFDALRDPDFDFPTRRSDKIEAVSVVGVVAHSAHFDAKRISLEVNPGLTMLALARVLEEHGIDLAADDIHGVRLQFTFEGIGRGRFRTVSLFNPNSSNLNDTPRDCMIRRYLKEWGIDARPSLGSIAVPTAAE